MTVLSTALGCDECGQQYRPGGDHPGEFCRVCYEDGRDPYEDDVPYIVPFDITEDMVALAGRIRDFYGLPGMGSGGPLHIVSDDNNVEDSHLAFCRDGLEDADGWWLREGVDVATMRELGTQILDGLAALSVAQRAWVTSFHYKLVR